MKKCVVAILCFSLALMSFTVAPLRMMRTSLLAHAGPDDNRNSSGREYTRDEIRAYERREREARDATRNARQNLTSAETAIAAAQGKQDEAEARLESWRTANRISESNLNRVPEDVRIEYEERRQKAAAAAREVTAATARRDAARLELNAAVEEQRTAEENTQLAQANCSDCSGRNRQQQTQPQITSLYPPESTTAQIIRALGGAIGPVAIAGLGAYTSVQAINSQSGDYRQYLTNATALGLPAYPPNGYGGAYGAALGPSLWGLGAMAGYGGGGYMWGGPFIAGAGAGIYANAGIYGGAYPGYPYGGGAYPGYPYGAAMYPGGVQLGAGYLVGAIGAPYAGGSFGVPYMPVQAGYPYAGGGYPGYPYAGGGYPGYPGGAYPTPYAQAGFQFGFPGPGNTYASPFNGYNAYNYGGLQGYNPWLQQTQMQTQYGMQAYYQQQYMNSIAYQQLGAQLQQQAGVASARLADAQSYYNYTMSMLQTQYYNGYTASYGAGYGYNTYGGGNSFRGGGLTYGTPYSGYSYGVNDFRGGGGAGGVYPAGGVPPVPTGGIPPVPTGGIPTPYPAGGNTGGFPRR